VRAYDQCAFRECIKAFWRFAPNDAASHCAAEMQAVFYAWSSDGFGCADCSAVTVNLFFVSDCAR